MITGFQTQSSNLPFLPGTASESEKVQVINSIISQLNTINDELVTVTGDDKMLKIVEIGSTTIGDISLTAGNNQATVNVDIATSYDFFPTLLVFREFTTPTPENVYFPLAQYAEVVSFFTPTAGVTQLVNYGFSPIVYANKIRFTHTLLSIRSDGGTNGSNITFSGFPIKYYLFRNTAN